MSEDKQISTTALAKKHNVPPKEMFARLLQMGLIEQKGDVWSLTDQGVKVGGKFVTSQKYGKYITWPEDLNLNITSEKLITSTAIGKHYELSANKINYILSELGWVQKVLKGWRVTLPGEKNGGLQDEDKKSGIPYVRWPESIIESKILKSSIQDIKGTKDPEPEPEHKPEGEPEKNESTNQEIGFRDKFIAKHRSTDGHFVRSKAEMLIDNWLYMAEIVHAYERKLPIEEEVYSDFYIPTGKVYIEFWGYDNNERYLKRKQAKQEIYKKYGFNLIELTDDEVLNLDDILPRLLLKHGVQAY
ncbi:MAG: glycerol kinase [Proteobacteria bacterium]|nr:glycerol kinase [Pseudomonadota bacterium]MBU1709023.1 glycerol kinase [Pseudomonadota bacterium]